MVFCAFYSLLEKTQLNFRYIILKLKMFKYQRRSDIWSQSGGAYGYFVGVLFYFLGDPRPVKLIILMELWGGRSGWAFAQCSLTTFNYSLCLEVFWSFQDKNLSRVFAASSPLQWCLTMFLEISWKTQNNLVQWNSAVGESESVPMRDNIFIAASGQACIVLPWSWLRQKFSEILASKDSLMEALWYSGHTFYEHEQFH